VIGEYKLIQTLSIVYKYIFKGGVIGEYKLIQTLSIVYKYIFKGGVLKEVFGGYNFIQ
jgi:hypothetical protein